MKAHAAEDKKPAEAKPKASVSSPAGADARLARQTEVVEKATQAIEAHAAAAREGKLGADVIADAAQKIDAEALEAKQKLSHPEEAKKADDAKAAAEAAAKDAAAKHDHEA